MRRVLARALLLGIGLTGVVFAIILAPPRFWLAVALVVGIFGIAAVFMWLMEEAELW